VSVCRRLSACFADDARFWRACIGLFASLAVLKGLRLPGSWAATQASFDYGHGFIKRGLFGAVMRLLDIPIAHYQVFVTVSAVTLAAFFAVLMVWVVRSGVRRLGDGALLALFAASYCVTFLTHMIGYLDIPSGILAVIALLASSSRGYLGVVLICGVLGVLIHENYLFSFLPVTLLPAVLRARQWAMIATVAIIVGAVVVLESLAAPMDASHLATLVADLSARVDFQPRREVLEVLGRSSAENLQMMLGTLKTGIWWLAQANAFLAFMPTTALFIWAAFAIIDAHAGAGLMKAGVVVAALSPLLLQFVGWDIYRWYALASLSSFLALTVVCRHYSEVVGTVLRGPAVRNAAVALIAMNMATGTGLFDYYHVDTFPFIDHWRGLADWIAGGGRWPTPAR
jgi:hypothetical protein